MKVSIYGAGYVGLVTGVCFAEIGHDVCCADVDVNKITRLQQGILPIHEENLEVLLNKNAQASRIHFTCDMQQAVNHGIVQIIAVGTPSNTDGSADLQHVNAVAEKIGELMTAYRCVINKSTVPVGTAGRVETIILKQLKQRDLTVEFDVVSNPEFLREGQAVKDCLSPDRIVIGAQTKKAISVMEELYFSFINNGSAILCMDTASAELTKYAANAFLATKVSFINEISQIAERIGANIHAIKKGIGMDSRINEKFLNAGCGFGGSCFPKDLNALKNTAESSGYNPLILNAVLQTNLQQQKFLFHKIYHYFNNDVKNKTIALWGLSFKPNTDDVRCATSRILMEMLWDAGTTVQAYDPLAMGNIRRMYPLEKKLILCESAMDAARGSDALIIVTEWSEFEKINLYALKQILNFPVVFDGRNIFDANKVREAGLEYFGIGC